VTAFIASRLYSRRVNGPHHSVLIVEDDRDFRDALQTLLTLHGLDVFCALDGQEALDMLHRGLGPCVILLDLMMPRMSGAQFRHAQQGDPDLQTIPVVVLSASANGRTEARAMGISDFMKKPIDLDHLLETVERYCGHPHDAVPPPVAS
jgi:two-component system, chemotaxis family, chemotaxis protein CheY